MAGSVIGLLHPGEMGAAVAGCLTAGGHQVLWLPSGRSPETVARATAAGLSAAGSLADLAGRADVILSACPPHAALEVARSVAGARPAADSRSPALPRIYVDANAISPATAREACTVAESAGASYVDGGIIGPPPGAAAPGGTRLYLSGPLAARVADLFAGTPLDARVIEGKVTASAVKMAYAGWTKGTAALILAVRELARAEGVEDTLLAEWALS
jgi:3-hydroxyisobutyrate dehydrogenase-like beta-hydroxyacid dehydrogenase